MHSLPQELVPPDRRARSAVALAALGLALAASGATAQERSGTVERFPRDALATAHEAATTGLLAVQEALLKASNVAPSDIFGVSVAVSGDTLVVGADSEDSAATGVDGDQQNDGAHDSGAVYVFVREGTTWTQEAYLKASNTEPFDRFGAALALSGDTLVVGAWLEDSAATGVGGDQASNAAPASGAVYVFAREGTTWSQQAYLKASNTQMTDRFGWSVAIDGDTIVVGADLEDGAATGVNGDETSNAAEDAGAAYVFVREGTTWSQQAYLKASNAQALDRFGTSVAVDGDTIVVGAMNEGSAATGVNGDQSSNLGQVSGAAYVFRRSGTAWSQEAYLKASNTGTLDQFGVSVAVTGDTAVVGAHLEDSAATGVDGDQASNTAPDAGAAYVFARDGTTWSQQAYLKASSSDAADRFGFALAVSGDTVVVGALDEDSSATGIDGDRGDDGTLDSGAAYVFRREAGSWTQTSYLKASDAGSTDQLGRSVAVDGDTVVAGAGLQDDLATDSGAAYVFRLGVPAAVLFRSAGTNPASYAADPIAIGGAFHATVDNASAGQLASLLFAFEAPVAVPLANGATLLCLDQGSGELFTGANLAPTSSAGGIDSYDLLVPDEPALAGFCFSSQAIQFGHPPFALSNAQDFTVGGF